MGSTGPVLKHETLPSFIGMYALTHSKLYELYMHKHLLTCTGYLFGLRATFSWLHTLARMTIKKANETCPFISVSSQPSELRLCNAVFFIPCVVYFNLIYTLLVGPFDGLFNYLFITVEYCDITIILAMNLYM